MVEDQRNLTINARHFALLSHREDLKGITSEQ